MALSGTTDSGCVTVRGVTIGSGRPKICVPVLGRSEADILSSARAALDCRPDVVEWRMDWFEGVEQTDAVISILRQLRYLFDTTPLLCTFRSAREGGEQEITPHYYVDLLCRVSASGDADLVDVELFSGPDVVDQIVATAHQKDVAVIGSSHDFSQTPPEEEIISRLEQMATLGCDIAKIAVMPQTPGDVLTLLSATERMHTKHPEIPIITMSMGQLGLVSRLCGEVFGSALTFGAAGQVSAPGQAPVQALRQVLELLHCEEND